MNDSVPTESLSSTKPIFESIYYLYSIDEIFEDNLLVLKQAPTFNVKKLVFKLDASNLYIFEDINKDTSNISNIHKCYNGTFDDIKDYRKNTDSDDLSAKLDNNTKTFKIYVKMYLDTTMKVSTISYIDKNGTESQPIGITEIQQIEDAIEAIMPV